MFNVRFKSKKETPEEETKNFNENDNESDNLTEFNQDVSIDYLNLQISARLSVLPETDDHQTFTASSVANSSSSSSNKSILNRIQKNALVCVARRLPLNNCESSFPVEQFSTELDLDGNVLDVDTTGLNEVLKNCVQRMLGKNLKTLVLNNQIEDMNTYLDKIIKSDTSIVSDKFNFKIFDDELIIKMKSKKNNNCIITTHSIIKPLQSNEQSNKLNFKSSSLSTNKQQPIQPIQVQQVQLKQTVKTTKRKNSTTSLSPEQQTPLYSSTSSFDYSNQQTSSSTLNSSTTLVPFFNATCISTNSGSLSTNSSSNSSLNKTVNSAGPKSTTQQIITTNQTDATNSSIDMLNDCFSISDLFPSSSLLDYDNLTLGNSTDHVSANLDFNEFNNIAREDTEMIDQLNSSSQQDDKLRNILQQDTADQNDSFSKQMSNLTTNMSKMDANQPSTSGDCKNNSNNSGSLDKESNKSGLILNQEIINQNDFRMMSSNSRPSSSLSNTNVLNNELDNLFSDKCNTIKTSTYSPNNQQSNIPIINSPSSNKNSGSIDNTGKGNNMLRKLLNDEDKGTNSNRKNKDVLIQQLLRENNHQSPSTPPLMNTKLLSPIDQNSNNSNSSTFSSLTDQHTPTNKFGPLKRKSNEDHFSNMNTSFLNSSNNSCLSNSQPGTPNQLDNQMDTTYPTAKRLSLSESLSSRPSSTPIPVTSAQNRNPNANQVRYSTSSNNLNLNNQQSINQSTSTLSVNSPMNTMMNTQQMNYSQSPSNYTQQPVQQQNLLIVNKANQINNQTNNSQNPPQQSQQLAGSNPMLASMLAQTPKTPPVLSISISTSIVSQVPQERLPKNLEKKLIHTPTSVNPQYSTTNQFDNEQQRQQQYQSNMIVTSQMNSSASINNQSSNQHNKSMFSTGNNSQQPFFISNRTTSNLQHAQMKPVQLGLSGQFVQSNDHQQQTPLSKTTHLLNSSSNIASSTHHQPVQPTSVQPVQVSGNSSQSYLTNNKATGILPNISSNSSEPKSSSSLNSGSFAMNSSSSSGNQMPIMNVQQGRNQQTPLSSCSFYSDRISSSSNLSESNSVAISSSTNGNVSSFFVLFLF